MCRYRNKSYVCSHVLAFRPLWWHSVGADVFVLRRRRRFVSFVCLPLLKKYILIFPHALFCELFSGRDDGHRERRHEEERVFTRRARIEEFPQCGRGFSVRTFVASFVLRVRLIIRIRALRVVLLCGVASMTRCDRNFKTSSSSSSETFGDARIPKRREFWTWHSRRGREKKIIASC